MDRAVSSTNDHYEDIRVLLDIPSAVLDRRLVCVDRKRVMLRHYGAPAKFLEELTKLLAELTEVIQG